MLKLSEYQNVKILSNLNFAMGVLGQVKIVAIRHTSQIFLLRLINVKYLL